MNLDSFWGAWNVAFNVLAAIIGFLGPFVVLAILICLLIVIGLLLADGIKWAYQRFNK